MSEPIERLSRFTPDAAGLDRDALLFKAGRASARPNRRWQAVCATLMTTQLLTLGLVFWPRPEVVLPERSAVSMPVAEAPRAAPVAPYWQQRDLAVASDGNLPAPPLSSQMQPGEPPLRAFGPLPASLLN
jgi:hypothetical protein